MDFEEIAHAAIERAIDANRRDENGAVWELARAIQEIPSYYHDEICRVFHAELQDSECGKEGSEYADIREQLDYCLTKVKIRVGETTWTAAVRRARQRGANLRYHDNERTNLLMCLLVELSGQDQLCYISLSQVEDFLQCTRRTANIKMQLLKDQGLIDLVSKGNSLHSRANVYHVNMGIQNGCG